MKKVVITLAVSLFCLTLFGCKDEISVDDFTDVNSMEIDSETYTFPMTVAEFEEAGWKMVPEESDLQVGHYANYYGAVFIAKNGSRIRVEVGNPKCYETEDEVFCDIEDARILSLTAQIDEVQSASIGNVIALGADCEEVCDIMSQSGYEVKDSGETTGIEQYVMDGEYRKRICAISLTTWEDMEEYGNQIVRIKWYDDSCFDDLREQ